MKRLYLELGRLLFFFLSFVSFHFISLGFNLIVSPEVSCNHIWALLAEILLHLPVSLIFFLRFICRLRSVISSVGRDYRYDLVSFESTKSITLTFSSINLVFSSSLRASFLVIRSYYYFSKRHIQPFAWGFITYIFFV